MIFALLKSYLVGFVNCFILGFSFNFIGATVFVRMPSHNKGFVSLADIFNGRTLGQTKNVMKVG